MKLGFLSDEDVTNFLSRQYGVPAINNLSYLEIDPAVVKLIPYETAKRHQILPLSRVGPSLTIAMANPTNVFTTDEIKFMTGFNIEPVVASESSIIEGIDKAYGTSKDGTRKVERVELPDGQKAFDVTTLPDGTQKVGRIEFPDGKKEFDQTTLPDGTKTVERVEHPNRKKEFDWTRLPDGTGKVERIEFPSGDKQFDATYLPDGTQKTRRIEFPSGNKQFDVTWLPDGTIKAGHLEFPNGKKEFDWTWLPDGTQKVGRVEFPNGQQTFDVTTQQPREAPSRLTGFDLYLNELDYKNGCGCQFCLKERKTRSD